MLIGTLLLSMIVSGVDATPALLLRTSSGDAYAAELSQLSEVTFQDGKVCVNVTRESDFTTTDSEFVSIRFDKNYTGGFGKLLDDSGEANNQGQNSIIDVTVEAEVPAKLYDMNGRFVGTAADNLASGVYMIVKPGQKATKIVVK